MDLSIIGKIPNQHPAESSQFIRIIEILKNNIADDWGVLILDVSYTHKKGEVIEYDLDWNGQIDALLICKQKIIVYELKGYTAKLLHATTNEADWEIKTSKVGYIRTKSFFIQVSKCRAFILQESLPEYFKEKSRDSHWIVDGRLIFKDSSDLEKFFQKIPKTISKDQFSEMLRKISSEMDASLFRKFFFGVENDTGKHQAIIVSQEEYSRMYKIYEYTNTEIRTKKWFKLLKEKDILSDIEGLKYDRFEITKEEALGYGTYLKEKYG